MAIQLIISNTKQNMMSEKKKDKMHKHFVNDDPTEFDQDKLENLAKEAIKKFKSVNG